MEQSTQSMVELMGVEPTASRVRCLCFWISKQPYEAAEVFETRAAPVVLHHHSARASTPDHTFHTHANHASLLCTRVLLDSVSVSRFGMESYGVNATCFLVVLLPPNVLYSRTFDAGTLPHPGNLYPHCGMCDLVVLRATFLLQKTMRGDGPIDWYLQIQLDHIRFCYSRCQSNGGTHHAR